MASATPARDRARTLHDQSLVITSHDHLLEEEDLLAMRAGGLDARVCMLQVDALVWDEEGTDSALAAIHSYEGWARRALIKVERMLRLIERHPDRLLLVRGVDDLLEAQRSGRGGIILGLEGTRPLEGQIELLGLYHRLGLRHLQLTWAYGSQVCDRVTPPPGALSWTNFRGTKAPGLTEFGREVVREANRLGIVLDPSHATAQTYRELFALSTQPIVISHATCRDAGKNAGDVTDEQLRALAANGGVICMHFFAHYLRDRAATIDDLVDHIEHAARVAGIDHIGIGPDWLHMTPEFLSLHDRWSSQPQTGPRPPDRPLGPLAELDGIEKLPRLTERLVERGFAEGDIRKILGGNLLRVYRQVWGGAAERAPLAAARRA
jgi:membrane dipeptidase